LKDDWNLPVTNWNQRTFTSRFGQRVQYEKGRLSSTSDTGFSGASMFGESQIERAIFGILCQNHAAPYFK